MVHIKLEKCIRTMLLILNHFSDFNQDGKPDNISFMIKRVKVHSNPDPTYKFLGNYGVEKFLEIFSGKSKSTKYRHTLCSYSVNFTFC